MIKEKKQTKKVKSEVKKLIPVKGFKSVEGIRKVRDEMYEKNKNLTMKEYAKKYLQKKL
ncbi:MAG: hypothetical protein IPM96_02615 [Ignavibacteria bacterium]|nr:hypothetical protein [Ignavibacteria bacterium]